MCITKMCIQFLSLLPSWALEMSRFLMASTQGKEKIPPRMEQRWNLDCSSELFALLASTAFLVLLPLRDHHLQYDKLVTPDAFFPFWVCVWHLQHNLSALCIDSGKVDGLNRTVPFLKHFFRSKRLCFRQHYQHSCSKSKLACVCLFTECNG